MFCTFSLSCLRREVGYLLLHRSFQNFVVSKIIIMYLVVILVGFSRENSSLIHTVLFGVTGVSGGRLGLSLHLSLPLQ